MPTINDLQSLPIKTLIYGDGKAGKSYIAGRLAATRKVVYIDTEGSSRTFIRDENLSAEAKKNLNLIRIPDSKDLPLASVFVRKLFGLPPSKVFNLCVLHSNENCPACRKVAGKFHQFSVQKDLIDARAILVIDSLSQLTSSLIEFIRSKENAQLSEQLTVLSMDNMPSIKALADSQRLSLPDWGLLGDFCWGILKSIQSAPFDIVAITHSVKAPTADGAEVITPAMGTERFSNKVANHFDNVIYAQFKFGKRVYQTVPSIDGAVCGSRDGIDISKVPSTHYSILEPFYI